MKEFPNDWAEMRKWPVAILGEGKSGQALKVLLNKLNWDSITFDQSGNSFDDQDLNEISLVLHSPGFRPDHPWIVRATQYGKEILNEIDFAARFVDGKVIAITGTNGKSSLTTLLTHVWKKIGRNGFAGGNLGRPLSAIVAEEECRDAHIFLEISSFQSRNIKYLNPDALLWTNFTADHLNFHGSEREYFQAKHRLVERTPYSSTWVTSQVFNAAHSLSVPLSEKIRVPPAEFNESLVLPEDHFLLTYPQMENMALASSWLRAQGLDWSTISAAMSDYVPEPHRLSKVCTIDGMSFWNDSKSTNLGSTVAACRNFSEQVIWIGGGQSKGECLNDYGSLLSPYIKKAFLIGETAKKLSHVFSGCGVQAEVCTGLKEAVRRAYEYAQKTVNILFSPGFSSFDNYKNYLHRGNSFLQFVLDLKKTGLRDTQVVSSFHSLSST
jgi:UDP-N-acetylmuramoylalanine--D-glutamate ligase